VLEGAAGAGAEGVLVPAAEALAAVPGADAVVLGTPVYRASYAAPLKAFLDALPRGMWGETTAPITGRAVAVVATGATWHHFLALRDLREVLSGFFAAWVVPPGLYVPHAGFTADRALDEEHARLAHATGRALVALAAALAADPELRAVRPQA
jgi:FMN reductase